MGKPTRPAPNPPSDTKPVTDTLVLSVALTSGRFESKLTIPFPCGADTYKPTMERWLDFIQTGFRIGATEMDAVLDDPALKDTPNA